MGSLHGVFPDGRQTQGVETFRQAYAAAGHGWVLAAPWCRGYFLAGGSARNSKNSNAASISGASLFPPFLASTPTRFGAPVPHCRSPAATHSVPSLLQPYSYLSPRLVSRSQYFFRP